MWLAHALTLSRLPIAVALVLAYGQTAWAVTLVILAAATDAADGNVARAMQRRGRTRPDIGGWLDPLVDKVFVVIVLVAIWWHTGDLVLIGLVAAREIALGPLLLVYVLRRRPTSQLHARAIGKAATIAQFVACGVAIARPAWALPIAVIAAVLGVGAVIDYLAREVSRARTR